MQNRKLKMENRKKRKIEHDLKYMIEPKGSKLKMKKKRGSGEMVNGKL